MNFFHAVNATPAPAAAPAGISLDDRTRTARILFNYVAGTSYDWDLPSTAVAGDLVLAFLSTDVPFTTTIFGTPTGWTQHFVWAGTIPDNTGQLYTKVIDATDVALGVVSVPCIQSSSGRDAQCWTMIGTGIDKTTPLSDVGTTRTGAGAVFPMYGITPTANGLAVGFWAYDGGDGEPTTLTAGWTKLEESDCDPSSGGLVSGFASIDSTAGTAVNLTVTFQVSDGWGGVIVNLQGA